MYSQIKRDFETAASVKVADDGDLGLRMQIIAGEIATIYNQAEFCSKQILPQTATGEFLARHAQTRDIIKKRAASAKGAVLFKRTSAAAQDIIIPIGTICSSSCGNSVMYVTTEEKILAVGKTSVLVPVTASVIGKLGNIAALKVDILVSPIAGIDSVSNTEIISGGMEEEDDEVLRKRLLASYINPPNGANLKFYEQIAESVDSVWKAKAVASTNPNEIYLYITNFFRDTSDALCAQVQAAVEVAREVGMKVTVKKPTLVPQNVTLKVLVRDLHDLTTRDVIVSRFLEDRILELGIGESFNPYTMGNRIAQQIDGFKDLVFTSPTVMVKVTDSQVLSPGTISTTFVKEW